MKRLLTPFVLLALCLSNSVLQAAAAHADATGTVLLSIDDQNGCKAGREVMQGMVSNGKDTLYILFTHEKGANPVIARWVNINGVWTCNKAETKTSGLNVGHGQDLAYQANYANSGRAALLITKGVTATSGRDDNIAVVLLNGNGTIGTQTNDIDLPKDVTGFCYSATAPTYHYAARFTGTLYLFKEVKGKPDTGHMKTVGIAIPGHTADQGLDCSKNFIWSSRSIMDGDSHVINYVYQYTWAGKIVQKITAVTSPKPLGVKGAKEIEDVTHISTDFYIGVNRNNYKKISYPDLVQAFSKKTSP